MATKRKSKWNENSAIRGAIRRVFSRSPIVQELRKSVREERVQYKKDGSVSKRKAVFYKCAKCGVMHRAKESSVDHKDPVIDPKIGFQSWDIFVSRLFCSADKLQVLCSTCHDKKTAEERKIRNKYKKKLTKLK